MFSALWSWIASLWSSSEPEEFTQQNTLNKNNDICKFYGEFLFFFLQFNQINIDTENFLLKKEIFLACCSFCERLQVAAVYLSNTELKYISFT